jgi:general secretion pathway protein I
MRRPRKSKKAGGFTLVEVLAAITIMAIVLPVVMYGISMSTGLAEGAKQRAQATALAEEKLDQMIVELGGTLGLSSGDFGDEAPGFSWQSDMTQWEEPNMNQLQVTVTWTARGRQRSVAVSTLIYNNPSGSLLP